MTIEIKPDVLSEIKEDAKDWLDLETKTLERVLKEKRWDLDDERERTTMLEVYLESIAHRIIETLYPEEHQKVLVLISDVMNTMEQATAQSGRLATDTENEQVHN